MCYSWVWLSVHVWQRCVVCIVCGRVAAETATVPWRHSLGSAYAAMTAVTWTWNSPVMYWCSLCTCDKLDNKTSLWFRLCYSTLYCLRHLCVTVEKAWLSKWVTLLPSLWREKAQCIVFVWAISTWYSVSVRIPRGYSTGKGASTWVRSPYHNQIREWRLIKPAPSSFSANKARLLAASTGEQVLRT